MAAPGDKVGALVTGAARRIGAAMARRLAQRGHPVVVHYAGSRAEAEATAAAITGESGHQAVALGVDLTDRAATAGLLTAAARALGRPIGVLVNNASAFEQDGAGAFGADGWDRHIRVNLEAAAVLTRDLAAALPEGVPGVVVNLLDQKLWNLNPDHFTYTLAKAALRTATETSALAFAGRIRVVGIAPGLTLPSTRQSPARFAAAHRDTPLGRSSTVDDLLAGLDLVLDCPSLSGQVLVIDGGESLRPRGRDISFEEPHPMAEA